MEFILIWLLMSTERIASVLASGGSTLISIAIWGFVLSYVANVVTSSNAATFEAQKPKMQKLRKWMIVLGFVGFFGSGMGALLPDKKEMAIIIGGGLTYKVLASDDAKQIGKAAIDAIMNQVESNLQEPVVVPVITPEVAVPATPTVDETVSDKVATPLAE